MLFLYGKSKSKIELLGHFEPLFAKGKKKSIKCFLTMFFEKIWRAKSCSLSIQKEYRSKEIGILFNSKAFKHKNIINKISNSCKNTYL